MTRHRSWRAFAAGLLSLATLATTARASNESKAAGPTTVVFTKAAGTHSIAPGAQAGARRPILGDPYVSTGFIKTELPTSATGTPYVSTGYVKIETDPRGNPAPAPPAAKPPAALTKRIEQACGRTARDVEVRTDSPTTMKVRFKVRNLTDAEKVSRQILQIPDLLPYQVTFEVHMTP